MNDAIRLMLERYKCASAQDYENALKEIIQEIALLGLWRSKFFEHAAFYGGSALRILYGLDRFSEDLDFSLLKAMPSFHLNQYHNAVKNELISFGFDPQVSEIKKHGDSPVESAFIKANTLVHLISVGTPVSVHKIVPNNKVMTVKFEIDTDPSANFQTEGRDLLRPIPFSVKTFCAPDLFAGKFHCVLCRAWKTRVKGRDWYDLVWFIAQNIPLRMQYLRSKLVHSQVISQEEEFDLAKLKEIFLDKLSKVDLERAKDDVRPFIRDPDSLSLWSKDFFERVFERVRVG